MTKVKGQHLVFAISFGLLMFATAISTFLFWRNNPDGQAWPLVMLVMTLANFLYSTCFLLIAVKRHFSVKTAARWSGALAAIILAFTNLAWLQDEFGFRRFVPSFMHHDLTFYCIYLVHLVAALLFSRNRQTDAN